jgi:hypothetical protein
VSDRVDEELRDQFGPVVEEHRFGCAHQDPGNQRKCIFIIYTAVLFRDDKSLQWRIVESICRRVNNITVCEMDAFFHPLVRVYVCIRLLLLLLYSCVLSHRVNKWVFIKT